MRRSELELVRADGATMKVHTVPTPMGFVREMATIGTLGTISYISLMAATPGWMIFGVCAAALAIVQFIDMLVSFF